LQRLSYPSVDIIQKEKKTFLLHLISQFFNGIVAGIIVIQEIILKKSLSGTNFEVTILIYLTSISFLFSIYGTEIIDRSDNRAKTIFRIGAFGRGCLLLIPFFSNPWFYIAIITIMFITDALLMPSWNYIFRHNYTLQNRSKYYSYASSLSTMVLLVTSTIAGFLLDANNEIYQLLFPVAGLFGILYYYEMSKIMKLADTASNEPTIQKSNIRQKIKFNLIRDIAFLPVRNMVKICKENKKFFIFEINFFLYGMAFMVLSPAIPIFLVDYLNLAYTPISLAKGLIFHSALIIVTPLMGRFMGSGNPTKFCSVIFYILILIPGLLYLSNYLKGSDGFFDSTTVIYIVFFVFGIAMSGVTLAWNIGSIFYAPHSMVASYQAVHITFTGIRGLFAPLLGYLVIRFVSIEANFILSGILFFFAGTGMLIDYKKSNSSKLLSRT